MTHIHVLARIRRIRLAREGNGDSAGAGTPRVAETPVALPRAPEPLRSGEPTTNRSATPRVGRSALVGSPESRDKALNPASPLRGK